MSKRLLVLAGSARDESLNRQLQAHLGKVAEGLGYTVEIYPAQGLEAPIYNGDDEAQKGIPSAITQLNVAINAADKVCIVSPEYNSSIPALLKNALDWSSRDDAAAWKQKPVLLAAASPGGLGGIRGLNHLRDILSNLQAFVFPLFASCKNASSETIKNMDESFLHNFLKQGD